jgi:hypothetical protein
MGKMEELEEAMTLLDKMRKVIGKESYKAKVGSVFDAFPVLATFDAKVNIIDVDVDDDAPVLSTTTDTFSTPRAATTTDTSATQRAAPVHVATNNKEEADDDVSVEEPSYDHIRTHFLRPVIDFSALQGESDCTDDEWDAYHKIRKTARNDH